MYRITVYIRKIKIRVRVEVGCSYRGIAMQMKQKMLGINAPETLALNISLNNFNGLVFICSG